EPVSGVDAGDFALALTGSATATTPVIVAGGPSVYQVTVSGIGGSCTLGLNLVDDGSIGDQGGNPLSQSNAAATLQNQVTFAVGSGPRTVAAADLNGDGKFDLAVSNNTGPSVSILLGNGNGTFQGEVDFAVASDPHGVVAADLNGDGHLDLVMANNDA